jgi:hypothetical protein
LTRNPRADAALATALADTRGSFTVLGASRERDRAPVEPDRTQRRRSCWFLGELDVWVRRARPFLVADPYGANARGRARDLNLTRSTGRL